jgi:hypothetical protein
MSRLHVPTVMSRPRAPTEARTFGIFDAMWRSIIVIWLIALLGCGSSKPAASTTSSSPTPAQEIVTPRTESASTGSSSTDAVPASPGSGNRCDMLPTADLTIDGLLDDWRDKHVLARVGSPADGAVEVRCVWDGKAIAFAIDVKDDRVIRVKGGKEDHVTLSLSAGTRAVVVDAYPGNSMAKPKITKPARAEAADSLQPKGFSVEVAIPAAAIPDFSPATPSFALELVFHDSDAATGGDLVPIEIKQPIELGDRKDLLEDFLTTVRLRKTDIRLDTLVELEPDHKGKERLIAGGNVIGVLTEQFAYVTLPAASAQDVKKVELMPLGPKGQQIVTALVRQTGNGGARELLMMWTVWSGQLQPLVNIEVKKEMGSNVLEATWKLVKGKKGNELVVEPKPAIGFTAETFNEVPAGDSDSILLPWDPERAGIAYSLKGAEIERRDLPKKKKR